MTSPTRCLAVFAALALVSGCLSSSHSIPKEELVRIAKRAPEQRGERVRVVQTFTNSEQPPRASEGNCGGCGVRVHAGSNGRSSSGRGRHSSSSGGGGGGGGGKISGEAAAALAVVVLASAAVIGVVAASSEGARYDGWAKLSPNHPLHLYGPSNSYRLISLDDLTVEEAEWATRAYVRNSEGHWEGLGRAPLNRQGWAYSVFIGAGEIGDMGGAPRPGTVSHIQLGYFPTRALGIHGDVGFGWGGPGTGKIDGVRFEASAGLEAQYLPFRAGKIHGGAFAQMGKSLRTVSAGGGTSSLFSAGGLMQYDITTRLALTGRAGLTRAYGEPATEISLGLSIY